MVGHNVLDTMYWTQCMVSPAHSELYQTITNRIYIDHACSKKLNGKGHYTVDKNNNIQRVETNNSPSVKGSDFQT